MLGPPPSHRADPSSPLFLALRFCGLHQAAEGSPQIDRAFFVRGLGARSVWNKSPLNASRFFQLSLNFGDLRDNGRELRRPDWGI